MKEILRKIFPNICVLCGLPSKRSKEICVECEQDLPWRNQVNNSLFPGFINDVVAVFFYKFPVDHLITGLKFSNNLVYGKTLGGLMAKKIFLYYENKQSPQVVIPVPLHNRRLSERGFNQSLELAKIVAKQLILPVDYNICERKKNTRAQSELSARKRHSNIKNAFEVNNPIPYQYAAVLDDVVTTGSTIVEFCKTLYDSGVRMIDVWCCAKT